MARRRQKQMSKKKREIERLREERKLTNRIKRTYEEHPKSVILALGLTLLLVVVGIYGTGVPPNYLACLTSNNERYHTHTWVYIGVGNASEFDYVDILPNMGIEASCMYALHTHERSPDERTEHYTKIHVEAPWPHTYVLGDIFYVWSEEIGSPVYFSNDGVSTYRGHISVYVYPSEFPDADNLVESPAYLWTRGDVRQVPLINSQFIYVHLEWPFTNTA